MTKSEKNSYTTTHHISQNQITNLNVQTGLNKAIKSQVTAKSIPTGGTGELNFDKRFVSKVDDRPPN